MKILLLALTAYIYNPSDWLQYPDLNNIKNFTSDKLFNDVFCVTNNSIVALDDISFRPSTTYGPESGLPSNISMAVYDRKIAGFWVVTTNGALYEFNSQARITSQVLLNQNLTVSRMGLNADYVFLDHGSSLTSISKNTKSETDTKPDSTVTWYGLDMPENKPRSYPFLAPWFMVDPELSQRPYSRVYVFDNKAFVTVSGYGYLVFDALAWRELARYQSPTATNVSSFFTSDSSLYAFGSNGVDQILPKGGTVFHSFSRWGTTTSDQPSWSLGLANNLRTTGYDKARLAGGNVFLLDLYRIDVFNIAAKTLSTITTQKTIYDVDFHMDSLFVASQDGITLAIIPKGQPAPLQDDRSKLVRNNVYAIVSGKNSRYFWTGSLVVKQSRSGWAYYVAPGFMPVPQRSVTGTDSLVILGGKGGVTIYKPETNFQLYLTSKDGLLSDNVTSVYLSGRYLWIASDAGYSRLDLRSVLP